MLGLFLFSALCYLKTAFLLANQNGEIFLFMLLGNELLRFDVAFYLCIMTLIRAAAILDVDNRFRIPSLKLKCLGTSFGAQKQKFSIPRDSTWPPCN